MRLVCFIGFGGCRDKFRLSVALENWATTCIAFLVLLLMEEFLDHPRV